MRRKLIQVVTGHVSRRGRLFSREYLLTATFTIERFAKIDPTTETRIV